MPTEDQRKRQRRKVGLLILGGACLAGGAMLYLYNPAGPSAPFPPCPFHWATGFHCPGCGSLRATHQLLHGELWAAFRLNPLMVLSLPFLALITLRVEPFYRVSRYPLTPLICAAVLILYWGLRNLPFAPFHLLAPTIVSASAP